MDKIKIYKRLKNRKGIEAFYKKSADRMYTVRLDCKNGLFTLHSFNFEGNDVFDESSYKDESLTTYSDFDELILKLEEEFPGIEISF